MVVQDPFELFQRGTKICGPSGPDDERHVIKKVLNFSVVWQSILSLRAGNSLPFKSASVEGLCVPFHMRQYCSGKFYSLCSDQLCARQQHYYDFYGLTSPSIPQQSSATSLGMASGNVQDIFQAGAPSATIAAAGGNLVATDSQLPYVFSETSSSIFFNSPPHMHGDYGWRLVRLPGNDVNMALGNLADAQIWVCCGANSSENEPSVYVVKRLQDISAYFCTQCGVVWWGDKNVTAQSQMHHAQTGNTCVIIESSLLDAACMTQCGNLDGTSIRSSLRTACLKDSQSRTITESCQVMTTQGKTVKRLQSPGGNLRDATSARVSGTASVSHKRALLVGAGCFKICSSFPGAPANSVGIPECLASGSPVFYYEKGRKVTGYLDSPFFSLDILLDLAWYISTPPGCIDGVALISIQVAQPRYFFF